MNPDHIVLFDVHNSEIDGGYARVGLTIIVGIFVVFTVRKKLAVQIIAFGIASFLALDSWSTIRSFESQKRKLCAALDANQCETIEGIVEILELQEQGHGTERFRIGKIRFAYGSSGLAPYYGTSHRVAGRIQTGTHIEVSFMRRKSQDGEKLLILRIVEKPER